MLNDISDFMVPLFGIFLLPMASSVAQHTDGTIVDTEDTERVLPVHGGYITARYGQGVDPFTKEERFHQGIDIAAKVGTDVYAVAYGYVNVITPSATLDSSYGKTIILRHEGGYITLYAKLSEIFVKEGQTVKAGERIGLVGNTGRSTGPHLHFEIHKDGNHKDPEEYINFAALNQIK
jgi:murein DD-endopeptidase MepM/ murein hydrolase activator NlpD